MAKDDISRCVRFDPQAVQTGVPACTSAWERISSKRCPHFRQVNSNMGTGDPPPHCLVTVAEPIVGYLPAVRRIAVVSGCVCLRAPVTDRAGVRSSGGHAQSRQHEAYYKKVYHDEGDKLEHGVPRPLGAGKD